MTARGDRFTMGCINPVASHTLQHGVWAASQYFNKYENVKFRSHAWKYMITILAVTKRHYIVKMYKMWIIELWTKLRYTVFSSQISCLICLPTQPICRSSEFRQTQVTWGSPFVGNGNNNLSPGWLQSKFIAEVGGPGARPLDPLLFCALVSCWSLWS